MNPVHRLMTLVDGGVYVARPSPDCALLRALCDGGGEEVRVKHRYSAATVGKGDATAYSLPA